MPRNVGGERRARTGTRLEVENFRFHDLRHTFASWLIQSRRPLKEVQEALGHKLITITMRYSHLAPDHLRAAVATLDGVLPARAQVGQNHSAESVAEIENAR
jgi:integrase